MSHKKANPEALTLFPSRIRARHVPAKEMPTGLAISGGWDPKADKAYIPIADTAEARAVRMHEATHAIFSKYKENIDLTDQALEDVRVHAVWLDDISGQPSRDEQVQALRHLRAGYRRWMKAWNQNRGRGIAPELRAVYAVVLTRSVAILQKYPEAALNVKLVRKTCGVLCEGAEGYVNECINAVKAGDLKLAREAFGKYAYEHGLPPDKHASPTPKPEAAKGGATTVTISPGRASGTSNLSGQQLKDILKDPTTKITVSEEHKDENERISETPKGDSPDREERGSGDSTDSKEGSNLPPADSNSEPKREEISTKVEEPKTEPEIVVVSLNPEQLKALEREITKVNQDKEDEKQKELDHRDAEDASVVVVFVPESYTPSKSKSTPEKLRFTESSRHPSPMYIHQLNLSVPRKVVGSGGSDYNPTSTGMRVRSSRLSFAMLDSNTRVFERRTIGGSVLIDASGSMGITDQALLEIAERIPMSTVAYYSANSDSDSYSSEGHLVVYARSGKIRSKRETLPFMGSGNLVDLHALEWLLKQAQPRYFVTDLGFTGVCAMKAAQLTQSALKQRRIILVRDLNELKSAIAGKKTSDRQEILDLLT